MDIKGTIYLVFSVIILAMMTSCGAKDDNPGREYMPDMVHPISYQANYYNYYKRVQRSVPEDYHYFAQPRKPVEGTRPRGYIGIAFAQDYQQKVKTQDFMTGIPMNDFVPFYYEDSEEGRHKATQEITKNPFPITEESLKLGGELYFIYCGICHGSGGEGDGYLVRDDGKYPAVPTNLISEAFIDTTAGAYYYTIMYGKNVMGSYSSKLSYKERWDIIHYIRSMQAKEMELEYSASANTLNNEAVPYEEIADKQEEIRLEYEKAGRYAHHAATNVDAEDEDTAEEGN